MVGYRKASGAYIELDNAVPVGATLTPVALRPSAAHVFADGWATDPLNAAVCWRLKTAAEVNDERDGELQAFLDSAGGKVVKAIALVGIDKGLWTLAEIKAKYRSL